MCWKETFLCQFRACLLVVFFKTSYEISHSLTFSFLDSSMVSQAAYNGDYTVSIEEYSNHIIKRFSSIPAKKNNNLNSVVCLYVCLYKYLYGCMCSDSRHPIQSRALQFFIVTLFICFMNFNKMNLLKSDWKN